MALKNNEEKIKKTLIYNKSDYEHLSKEVKNNKASGNGPKSISAIVRNIISEYINKSNKKDELDLLIKYTQKELINYFTVEEAVLITAALNGTLYDVSTINPKIVLIGNVKDSILLDGYDTFYKVDKDTILKKLQALSEFQCYVVIQMAFEFLEGAIKNPIDKGNKRLKSIFLIKN
ncbi:MULTISPECIES: hypothetical protein [Clostridium]|jgi:hypothetical protein|uniref:hypothetical protein n=1 Tax=Clostridium TaxID=1485 RepID=UPI00243158CA|nr:hypothetical protein [Clostridium tyrobutyricum]